MITQLPGLRPEKALESNSMYYLYLHPLLNIVMGMFFLSNLAGCGANAEVPDFHDDLVPVRGAVLLNGSPFPNASVSFYPVGDKAIRAAYGSSNDLGVFEMMTPFRGLSPEQCLGVLPGSYRVVISKLTMPDGTSIPEDVTHADAMKQGASESLPKKYSSEQQTSLEVIVPASDTEPVVIDFDLQN